MATKRETVLQALFTLLSGLSGPTVLRNGNLPERIPAGGMIILRDGDPGEPEVLLSPPEYVYDHRADADVIVDAATPTGRDTIFDSILLAIGNEHLKSIANLSPFQRGVGSSKKYKKWCAFLSF